MEDRVVPAFDLIVKDNGGVNVDITVDESQPQLTVFTPNASGAILDIASVKLSLGPTNVRITSGSAGTETGNITFLGSGTNFTYSGTNSVDLTIRTDPSSTQGTVQLDGLTFDLGTKVDLTIDTSATNADINLGNNAEILGANALILNSGTGKIALDTNRVESQVAVLQAGTVFTGGVPLSIVGNSSVTMNAQIDLTGNKLAIHAEPGTISLNGAVSGANDFDLFGTTVQINAPIGAGATPLANLTFNGNGFGTSTVTHGPHAISAAAIRIGNAFAFDRVIFNGGTGTLTGHVFVNFDGALAPGGIGTVGTLSIDGSLTFNSGEFAIDLGTTPDRISIVSRNRQVQILGSSDLRIVGSTGSLPGPGLFEVIEMDIGGTLSGSFLNAPLNGPFVLGNDAIRVTNYGPDFMGIVQIPAAPGGIFSSNDSDGTRYTIKLSGPGEMAAFDQLPPNFFQSPQIVLRNTTLASQLSITTVANASDAFVGVGNVVVNGSLGKLIAPKADFAGRFDSTGPIGAIKMRDFFTGFGMHIGGTSADKTTMTLRGWTGPIQLAGQLTSLTASGDIVGSLTADKIGTLKARNVFGDVTAGSISSIVTTQSYNAKLQTTGPVGAVKVGTVLSHPPGSFWFAPTFKSITAGAIQSLDLFTNYLTSLTVTGNAAAGLAGYVSNSRFTVNGNSGPATGSFGIRTVLVKGTVYGSTFNVKDGNVGTFTVGRFVFSNLYLDYFAGPTFDVGGGFETPTAFKLGKFATTAITAGNRDLDLNWAFVGSQIAADTIGTVRLSGVDTDNTGVAFGIKFRTAAASVQAKTAGPSVLPLNTNLQATPLSLAGDFFLLDV